jgi:methyl-accepting chemotaxis protein
MNFRIGIFQRMLIMLLVVALVPLACIWLLNYQFSIDLAGQKVEQQLIALNNNLTTHVDDWVDMNERVLLQNASLEGIRVMQTEPQNAILETIPKQYDWAYLAFTIDLKGQNVGRSDGKKLLFYGDRSYFLQVINGNRFGQQVLVGKTSGKPALVLSTAVHDSKGGVNGVLAMAMTLTEISNEISKAKIGQTGFSFLLDEKGEVIAHPNEEFTRSRVDMSGNKAFQGLKRGEALSVFADNDGKQVVAVSRQTKQGWVMITQQDYQEAYQQISDQNFRAILLLVGTVVIVCLLALIASRRLTTPIRKLTEVAEQFSQGKLNLEITGLDRQDEIGKLAKAIERLGISIRMAMERLQKRAS